MDATGRLSRLEEGRRGPCWPRALEASNGKETASPGWLLHASASATHAAWASSLTWTGLEDDDTAGTARYQTLTRAR